MEGQIKYNTSVYMWGDIKECIDSLGVKIPPQLEHKNDDDPIQFVVYPGRSKEVKNQFPTFKLHIHPYTHTLL